MIMRNQKAQENSSKQLERFQLTERLRKEMLFKIKETKANMLAMSEQQQ